MKNLRVWNGAILVSYALALLLLAYFFFAHELHLISYEATFLSGDFMLRFFAFWFISFLLTVMVYLVNLSLNYFWLPRAEKTVAMQAGKLILAVGLSAAFFAVVLVSSAACHKPYRGQNTGTNTMITVISRTVSGVPMRIKSRKRYLPGL